MPRSLLMITVLALFSTLFGASRVVAQGAPGEQPGITTTGYGEATAPAESARLQFLIINENFYGGPPQAPQVEATPGATARSTVAPIVQAIEGNDAVERVEVVIPLVSSLFGGPAPVARIDVSVTNPDLEGLTNLINSVTQAASRERVLVGYVGASFETSDCNTLEREARQAALDDARSRAGIQAELLGVGLGEVVATSDVEASSQAFGFGPYGAQLASSGGCDPEVSSGSSGELAPGITLPAFDPGSHSGEVEVYRQLRVTFAIEGSTGTPAA